MGFGYSGGWGVEQLKLLRRFASRRSRHVFKRKSIEKKDLKVSSMGGLDKKASAELINDIRDKNRANRIRKTKRVIFGTFLLFSLVAVAFKWMPRGDAHVLWRVPEEKTETIVSGTKKENYYAREGRRLLTLGKYEEALRVYQQGKKEHPDEYAIQYGEALTWMQVAKKNDEYLSIAVNRIENLYRNHPEKQNAKQLKENLEVYIHSLEKEE